MGKAPCSFKWHTTQKFGRYILSNRNATMETKAAVNFPLYVIVHRKEAVPHIIHSITAPNYDLTSVFIDFNILAIVFLKYCLFEIPWRSSVSVV